MDKERPSILVIWDFSDLSKAALIQALKLADRTNYRITLLASGNNKKEVEAIKARLKKYGTKIYEEHGIRPGTIVKKGNLNGYLSDLTKSENYKMLVMPTGEVKGMEKLTGAKSMKTICQGDPKVPVVVVQQAPKLSKTFDTILMPIDHTFESKQKLKWIKYLSNFYKFKVHIVAPNFKDGVFRARVKNNLVQTRKQLTEKEIEYEIITGADKGNYAKAINDLAHKIEADLIVVMMPLDPGFTTYMFGPSEQKVIANEYKIPVMCLNPKDTKKTINY